MTFWRKVNPGLLQRETVEAGEAGPRPGAREVVDAVEEGRECQQQQGIRVGGALGTRELPGDGPARDADGRTQRQALRSMARSELAVRGVGAVSRRLLGHRD